jgi:proteasome lid subunit RPN8/RPN11
LSDRAHKSILAETLALGDCETGGILLGHFVNSVWYVIECIDAGLTTVNTSVSFHYDERYVNHQVKKIGRLYNHPLTILGIWHRHPGSMDTFSSTDLNSIGIHVARFRVGVLSMLVNVDPKLRMSFYYCAKDHTLMKVPYDVGDHLVIKDLLSLADSDRIQENVCENKKYKPHIEILHKNQLPQNMMPLTLQQDPIPFIRQALHKREYDRYEPRRMYQ